jgi:hypothetical protein
MKLLLNPRLQRGLVTASLDLQKFLARNRRGTQLVGSKCDRMLAIIRAKLSPQSSRTDQAHFPATIEVLEYFAFEPGPRLVAEDQFPISDRRSVFVLPLFSYVEVTQHVFGNVGC